MEEYKKRIAAMQEARDNKRAELSKKPIPAAGSSRLRPGSPSVPPVTPPSQTQTPVSVPPVSDSNSLGGQGSRRGVRPGQISPLNKSPSTSSIQRTDSPGARSESAGDAARELNLCRTELKVLKLKFDSEVKKREALEAELASLKQNASSTANAPLSPRKSEAPRISMKMDGPTRNPLLTGKASDRNRSQRATKAPATNVVAMITRVLQEMEKLEGNIKRADTAREQAETELLEVAMYKQAADEALQSLVTDITAQLNVLSTNISNSNDINQAKRSVDEWKTTVSNRLQTATDSSSKTAEVTRRTSQLVSKLEIPAPPAPAPPGPAPPGPAPPGPARPGPTRAARPVRDDQARASTLLSQIRKGKDLNKIDINAIKQERQLFKSNSRTSMALLSSLQETLRAALNSRQDDMNLYGEDEPDDWED